jgi:competence protein ComEC
VPLVAQAAFAYALGLFVAATAPPAVAWTACAGSLALGAVLVGRSGSRRRAAIGACAVLVGAGVLVQRAATDRRDRCRARFAGATSLLVLLQADAVPGAPARGVARAPGCHEPAVLLVREGRARAGERVLAHGSVVGGDRGLLMRDASVVLATGGSALVTARWRMGRRIDRIFGADAPVVRALVIGDMAAIPADQRDRFARAGLVHMLSVSGLHVAILALALVLVGSALRLPPAGSRVATVALLGLYVALIGAPPPAVRAGVMLSLVLASRLLQRPTSRWAVLAVGGVVPLIDPAIVTDLGWQLSVVGTVALVAGAALAHRLVPRAWRGARRTLATAMLISLVATVATAPLVAWTFGRLSLIGPVTNLVADPVMGLLQPLLFLALCVPFAPAERLAADAAHALLALFDAIATVAASLPYAAPQVLPSATSAIAAGVAATAIVVACVARRPGRALVVAAAAASVMVVEPLLPRRARLTELHMIDVGQGDALAIRTRAGRWIVVDAGRSWRGGDAGAATVVPYLAHRGGAVAAFVLSHPHADHVGGAAALLDALHPAVFVDPGYVGTTPPYLAVLAAARRDGIPWQRVHPGDSLVVDEVVMTLLAPDSTWAASLDDANLASTVAMVRIGAVRILLTGDAEGPEEEWLLEHATTALAADVLKVGHHGSRTSTTPRFLAAVRPRVALVSVGAQNEYGHPSADVLAALAASGARVFRTDRMGSVVVRTDGRMLLVEPARGPGVIVVPDPR